MSLSQLQSPAAAPPALPPWTSPDFVRANHIAAPDVDLTGDGDAGLTGDGDAGDMSVAIEQEVSALLGDLTAVRAKAARAEAAAERLRQENGYLQQQVQLEMSSSHRSQMDVLRLQEQARRAQSELENLRQLRQAQQQGEVNTVPLAVYDAVRDKAVALMTRARNYMRWRKVFRLWGQCKYRPRCDGLRCDVCLRRCLAGSAARPPCTKRQFGSEKRLQDVTTAGSASRRCAACSPSSSAKWAFSARESAWASYSRHGSIRQAQRSAVSFESAADDALQVRESLLLEVRLLRDTLRDAQGDIERCRYFSAEMTRREAEITQRAEAKVQQCVLLLVSAPT
jgi:TolA-binding protein